MSAPIRVDSPEQATITTFERYWDPAYKVLRRNLAGLVLFGTPHTTELHKERWDSLSFLLRSYFRLGGQSLNQAELEAATVARLSERFEESVRDLPVLSISEIKKTKTSRCLFGSQKRLVC